MEVGGGRRLRILEDLNMLYIRQIAASIQVGILGGPPLPDSNSGIPRDPPGRKTRGQGLRGVPGVPGRWNELPIPRDSPLQEPPKTTRGGILGGLSLLPAGGYL